MQNKKPTTPTARTETAAPKATTPFNTAPQSGPRAANQPFGRQFSHDQIAKRAYEIYRSGRGGSQDDNWFRAERELRAAG